MKPNIFNHKKKHGTFMYPGSTGFKANFSGNSFTSLPKLATSLILSAFAFMSVVAFSPIIAVVFAVGMFAFQMFFSTNMAILGNTPPSQETAEEKLARETQEKAFLDKVALQVKEIVNGDKEATKEEIKKLNEELASLKSSDVAKIVSDMQAQFKALQEAGKKDGVVTARSIETQLKEQMEKNAEKYAQFKKGEIKQFEFILDFKAAATMLESTNIAPTTYLPYREIVPGYVDLVRNRPFLELYANSSGTTSAKIVWVEKQNPDGTCAFIAEGAVKPLIDFDWVTNESSAKKVADKIKVSTEMLDDIPFMAAAIQNELRYQVDIKVDDALLSGAGGVSLDGITTLVGGYVLTSISTTDPTDSDAIRAAAAQIISLNFMPNLVFVNPIDAANMDLSKAVTSGVYMLPPFTTADGRTIAGAQIIETNQIPVGFVLIGDFTKFVVRNYKPFVANMGWVNDDFEKNLVTVIGERRLHSYIAENHLGAFVYDSLATIKLAL